jgi:hypothetical protein
MFLRSDLFLKLLNFLFPSPSLCPHRLPREVVCEDTDNRDEDTDNWGHKKKKLNFTNN